MASAKELTMTKYILLTEERQQVFNIKDCAVIFQGIWGGSIREVSDDQMDSDSMGKDSCLESREESKESR